MNKALSRLNLVVIALFFITLIMTFLYKETLTALLLSETEARVIIMTLISLILLISFIQTQLSLLWRIFCLVASFITLIESILMLGAWERLIR